HKLYDLDLKSGVTQFGAGAILAAGLLTVLAYPGISRPAIWKKAWPWWFDGKGLIFNTQWAIGPGRPPAVTTADIGALFMGRYLLPFEAASILLLVALIGAAMIVRRKTNA
ncbi:MAG: NADH-quinone oxidoreductase subunit J, partial [Vicinamibacteria bacterium]